MIIFSKQLCSIKTSIFIIIIRTNGYSHCYAFLQNHYCYMAYKQKKRLLLYNSLFLPYNLYFILGVPICIKKKTLFMILTLATSSTCHL